MAIRSYTQDHKHLQLIKWDINQLVNSQNIIVNQCTQNALYDSNTLTGYNIFTDPSMASIYLSLI